MSPEPASLIRRAPAFLLDQAVVILLVVPPVLTAGVPFDAVVSPGETRRAVFLALMAVAFLYHFTLELWTGQTVGKLALGLRTVRTDGSPLTLRASFLRNALRLVDGLGYWTVAVAVIVYRGDGKRIGDAVGDSLVVRADVTRTAGTRR
jgi:uncharacterized RDD family membrane protein YckC